MNIKNDLMTLQLLKASMKLLQAQKHIHDDVTKALNIFNCHETAK